MALLNGAKVVLIPKQTVLNIKELTDIILNRKITISIMPSALFNLIVELNVSCLRNAKKVLVGSERTSVKHFRKALKYLGKGKIVNLYGQTETSLSSVYYPVNHIEDNTVRIPIGRPVNNTSVYIVGDNNEIVPVGQTGELCISGDGLATGYLNNEKLTCEKFIDNPFKPGTKMYKTGNLARWKY